MKETYETFGAVLVHVLQPLQEVHFHPVPSLHPLERKRCENGIGLYIGARLSGMEGVHVSPQYTLGGPPSVGYYLSAPLDMHLVLTFHGDLLNEHFESFLETGQWQGRRCAVLDIEPYRSSAPAPLPAAVRMFEPCRYTYVVKSNALYRGTELYHHPVRPLLEAVASF